MALPAMLDYETPSTSFAARQSRRASAKVSRRDLDHLDGQVCSSSLAGLDDGMSGQKRADCKIINVRRGKRWESERR